MSVVMRRARTLLRQLFFEQVLLKLVSLGCAVALWAWVQSTEEVDRRVRVRVSYDWPAELVRVEEAPKQLVVVVRGPQGQVRNLEPRRLSMQVDMTDKAEGVNSVDFTAQSLRGLPQGLAVVQMSPPEADIILEPPLEKVVAVRPTLIGDPARGFDLREVKVEPEQVTIIGPRSQVQKLSQVLTDVVDVSRIRADRSFEVALMPGGIIQSAWQGPVQVSVDVEPLFGVRTFPEVPVRLAGEGAYRVTPEQVKVVLAGPVVELQELDSLSAVVTPPDEAEAGERLRLRYDPTNEGGGGFTIENKGGEAITVQEVTPSSIELHAAAQ